MISGVAKPKMIINNSEYTCNNFLLNLIFQQFSTMKMILLHPAIYFQNHFLFLDYSGNSDKIVNNYQVK
jgi:hypothetical protein